MSTAKSCYKWNGTKSDISAAKILQIYPEKTDATVQNKLLCRWHSLPKGPVEERKRNISFELSQQNLTNSIVDKVTEGWSPNTEFGSNKFWVNFALFLFSWCIFRVSSSLQLRIWCEGKDQTDKCHIHPFRKKLRAVFKLVFLVREPHMCSAFAICNLQCIDSNEPLTEVLVILDLLLGIVSARRKFCFVSFFSTRRWWWWSGGW